MLSNLSDRSRPVSSVAGSAHSAQTWLSCSAIPQEGAVQWVSISFYKERTFEFRIAAYSKKAMFAER